MISPTPRQLDLLRYIAGHIEAMGYAPRQIDCAAALGIHQSGIVTVLGNLEGRGLIRRLHSHPRAIEVLHKPSIPRAPDGAPLYAVKLP